MSVPDKFTWLQDDIADQSVIPDPTPHQNLESESLATRGQVPVVPGGSPTTRRGPRRGRPKDPGALRNDPTRMMAGARIPIELRRRVDQALADAEVTQGDTMNYSLLIEALLARWLEEVGYPYGS